MVRDSLTKRELEEQRKQAVEALERGFEPEEVSDVFGVAVGSVRRWRQSYEEGGMKELEATSRQRKPVEEAFLPERTREELAVRRKEAVRALRRGFTIQEVSDFLNVSDTTVREWRQAYKTEGLEGLEPTLYNDKLKPYLKDVSAEYLREILSEVESGKAAQRVMLALNYKEEDIISQQEIAERYGLSTDTVRDWLCRIERSKDEDVEEAVYDKKDVGFERRQKTEDTSPERTREELEARRKEAVKALERGFCGREVADFFDVSTGSVSEWKQTYEVEGMEGLEYTPRVGKRDTSTRLENISKNYLSDILSNVKGDKARRRVRMALEYKQTESTTQTEIAERYGVAQSTFSNWISRIEHITKQNAEKSKEAESVATELDTSSMNYLKEINTKDLKSELNRITDKRAQRLVAAILYKEGFTAPTIGDWLNVEHKTICNWYNRIENNPIDEAIQRDPLSGRSTKLPENKFSELEDILHEGADNHGFTGQLWTGDRVAKVIEQEFDVSVSGSTARNYLKRLGWSNQKPQPRYAKNDDEEIDNFLNEKWPEIRNNAKITNQAIIFIDETKFRLLPTLKRTWAPIGETPTVEISGLFSYVAVIGAIIYIPQTESFNFKWKIQRNNFNTHSISKFLYELIENTSHDGILLLDNLAAHKSATEELEKMVDNIQFTIEWFPEYSSDINPVDNVWGQAKYNELANYTPKDLDELELKVEETLSDIQADEDLLRYFIEDAGLEIEA